MKLKKIPYQKILIKNLKKVPYQGTLKQMQKASYREFTQNT